MRWNDFSDALARTLATLTDRCFLVVQAGEGASGFVQFASTAESLTVEAAGPSFTAGASAHTVTDPTMLAGGWTPPTGGVDLNWSAPLPLPALTAEYRMVAQRCVVALRDVYHVRAPAALTYRSWRDPEQPPMGVAYTPKQVEDLDPGANPLPLPTLGLRRA